MDRTTSYTNIVYPLPQRIAVWKDGHRFVIWIMAAHPCHKQSETSITISLSNAYPYRFDFDSLLHCRGPVRLYRSSKSREVRGAGEILEIALQQQCETRYPVQGEWDKTILYYLLHYSTSRVERCGDNEMALPQFIV